MNKLILSVLVAFGAEQAHAACSSKNDMKGTWDYYQAVAFAAAKSNISKCEAAFVPDTKTTGTFAGWCYISPGKGPKTVAMQGNYTVTDPSICAIEVKMDMGAMGISTFDFNLNTTKNGWAGMWKNVGGDYGTTTGVKISNSISTPITPTVVPYF